MFSFFRRSKKDQSENKEKKKEKSPAQDAVAHTNDNGNTSDDKGKNNPGKLEVAPQGGQITATSNVATESGIVERPPQPFLNESTLKRDRYRTDDQSNCILSGTNRLSEREQVRNLETPPADHNWKPKSVQKKTMEEKPISYATILRKAEPSRVGHSVKPCGHGTVAITPKIPVAATRRNSSATPPSSPKLDVKNLHRKHSSDLLEIACDKKSATNGTVDETNDKTLDEVIRSGSIETTKTEQVFKYREDDK